VSFFYDVVHTKRCNKIEKVAKTEKNDFPLVSFFPPFLRLDKTCFSSLKILKNKTGRIDMRKIFYPAIGSLTGFTIVELMVVLGIMSVLLMLSYPTLRTPKEKIACKNVFSAMQLAKMRAIATGYNAYVDFDMDGGDVSDSFYTVYLDTDDDKAFGEKNNAKGNDEFVESHFAMQNTWQSSSSKTYPAVALPSGTAFGLPSTNPPSSTPTNGSFSSGVLADGVGFAGGSKRIKFLPKGMPSGFGGSVYVYSIDDLTGKSCATVVASTGIIRMWTWNGSEWQ
jgi:prepilin-type N-terminal cleavage/methylation domain-containing protein